MAGELFRRLAVPRLHGSPGAGHVHALVLERLQALGYQVANQHFVFSRWPVNHGVRLLGLLLGALSVLSARLLAAAAVMPAFSALLAGLLLALLFAAASGWLVLHLRPGRATGTNLLATPPAGRVRFLIVAHRDSKSQPVPLALRIGAALTILLSWATLALLAARLVAGHAASPGLLLAAGGAGLAAGLVLACCGVGNRSAGALDNASGLAALLHIAEREREAGDVGLLVTDAEEYGLAGARAALAGRLLEDVRSRVEYVINLDGLDDSGAFFLLDGLLPPGRAAAQLLGAFRASAREAGHAIRRRPVPPGLMIDHLPFRASRFPAVTLMRGGLRSLARVHRPADDPARMSGAGVVEGSRLVCGALDRLRSRPVSPRASRRVAASAAND